MGSKQLKSILDRVPPATANGENNINKDISNEEENLNNKLHNEEYDRIVAQIPRALKEEIKDYIKARKGETERIIVLRALKSIGFNVPSAWLVDKRTLR